MRELHRCGRRSGQRGYTFWTIVLNGMLLAIVLVPALRVLPSYMTYLTVRDVVGRAAADFDPREDTLQDLRLKISKLMTTSQISDVTVADMEVYLEKG